MSSLRRYGSASRRAPSWAAAVGLPALAFLLVVAACVQGAMAREAVTWIQSYDEAIAEARRTGKPIFLEFRCAP